jgi:uncharacterized protein YukJ
MPSEMFINLTILSSHFLAIGVAFSSQTYNADENDNTANVIVQVQSGIVERDLTVR